MSAFYRVLRKLERITSVLGRMSASETASTYPKDIGDHRIAFVCTGCHKAVENKSSDVHLEISDGSREGLPIRTPQDRSDVDSAIHMFPYTGSKVPDMAYRICDDYNAVDTFGRILCCMNDWRNKEDCTSVDI